MSLDTLKRLSVRRPTLLIAVVLTVLLLVIGVDPVAAGPPDWVEPNGVFIGP